MNNVQKRLLVLMDEFDQICCENDIEYFFAGGTALGAVRNGGFLPWDDDADVLIKRKEFERLDRIMNEKEFAERAWITDANNKTYLNPVARYFDLNSTDILESRMDFGAPKGCQLEVFVMDPFPNEEEAQIEFIRNLWVYTEVTNNYILFGSLKMPAEMMDRDLYDHYKKRLETESVEDIKKEILAKMTYSEENCDYWCGRWSCMPYIFKKEWMASQKYVDFEGRRFPVPVGVFYEMRENYDANWDIIPPVSSQKIHPSIKSANVSYLQLEDKIREWCDEVQFNELLFANKSDRLERVFARIELEKQFAQIRQVYLSRVAEDLNQRKWHFDRNRLDDYEHEFEEYFLTQLKHSYSRYKYSVPLHEDLLETMILTLLHQDRVQYAQMLNALYPASGIYEKYEHLCTILGDLKIKKYEDNQEQVESYLEELKSVEVMIGQVEIERASAWRLSILTPLSEDEIETFYQSCMHKDDLELLKYIGDMYEKTGASEKANALYEKVMKKSRNGMILYDLKKRGIMKAE